MTRIRWYGPTLVLLVTVLAVTIIGPRLTQELAYAHKREEIRLIQQSLAQSGTLAQLSQAFRDVAKVVEPSVVHIQVFQRDRSSGQGRLNNPFEQFFGPRSRQPGSRGRAEQEPTEGEDLGRFNPRRQFGTGSGWVYDDKGHIVTNNHVITLPDRQTVAEEIRVRFHDGSERIATVVGTDRRTDLAVLKVEGPIIAARIAKQPVEQGDMVFAFGSPLRFEFSMSQGIVSGKGRRLDIIEGGYEHFIQTDAAINPGNSGGPLTNIHGEVVGVNTAIASQTGFFSGIGFAIPADMVVQVADQLIATGRVTRGYLGVFIEDLDTRMAKTFGYDGKGVLVRQPIPGGPGDKAGLKPGDIIISVDNVNLEAADALRNHIASLPPGRSVALKIFRAGEHQTLQMTIGELPEQMAGALGSPDQAPNTIEQGAELLMRLGLEQVTPFTEEIARRLNTDFIPGVLVGAVRPGSSAFAAGIGRGVIITHVMNQPIANVEDLIRELIKHDLTEGVRVQVIANGVVAFRLLELPRQ